jgi:HD-GYP domain-containing protein (c-di-GMP phosphodiesterase class II)
MQVPSNSGGSPSGIRVLSNLLAQMLRETLTFSPSYGERLGRYVRALASVIPDTGEYSRLKDERFLELVSVVGPLHDVGMLALPHTIIHKPGLLDAHERTVIETHPVLGAEWITATSEKCPGELPVLSLAADVVRSHHERWDGKGYPDGLAAEGIPLAARVVSFVSVYDALRSRRAYRPALSHARVVRMLATESVGQFDPTFVAGLEKVAPQLEKIFRSAAE